jgi:hypothetical protein
VIQVFTVDRGTTTTVANLQRTPMSFLNYKDFRDQSNVFSNRVAFIPTGVTLTGRADPKPENAMLVSANYFAALGVRAAAGRTFLAGEDHKEEGDPETVLSYSMAAELFGALDSALGQTVELNSVPYNVIGVAPLGCKSTFTVGNPELAWIPISMHARALPGPLERLFHQRRMRMINVFGQLKPGLQQPQAAAASLAQPTNEIELRMALGARPGDVSRPVVGQGMGLALAGIAVGIGSGLVVTRLMGCLLFDIPT